MKGLINAMEGGDGRTPTDVFGNRHKPDEVGYCSCWQCPTFDGMEWWQPQLKYSKGQRDVV